MAAARLAEPVFQFLRLSRFRYGMKTLCSAFSVSQYFDMHFTLDGAARKVVRLKTQAIKANNSPHILMWVVGVAIILFCFAGILALMGWIPTSTGHPEGNVAIANGDLIKPDQQLTSTAKPAPKKIYIAPVQVAAQTVNNAPTQTKCAECGVIESIREINTKGEGTGIGVVGGAVVGGLLGNQVGGGRGNDIATVAGAVGGAVALSAHDKTVLPGNLKSLQIKIITNRNGGVRCLT